MTRPSASGPDTPRPALPSTVAVQVEGLTIRSGDTVLVDDLSFWVPTGARVGLIGASGSGKTLTCLAIAGLLPEGLDVSGTIRVHGSQLDRVGASERELADVRGRDSGMIFQEPMTALNPTMRVGRQILEALSTHGSAAPRRRREQVVAEILEEVDLRPAAEYARAYPHQLSGGQRQRVVIAMALANAPALLLCDEPTTALDVRVQRSVIDMLIRRSTAAGAALLFVSHDLAVVTSICDSVLVLDRGRLVEQGTVLDIALAPSAPGTRKLLDAVWPESARQRWLAADQAGTA